MTRLLLIFGLVFTLFACASSPEPEPRPAPTPPPVAKSPPPEPEPPIYQEPEPRELPKTASSLPALGLSGLASLAGAGALGWLRRRSG